LQYWRNINTVRSVPQNSRRIALAIQCQLEAVNRAVCGAKPGYGNRFSTWYYFLNYSVLPVPLNDIRRVDPFKSNAVFSDQQPTKEPALRCCIANVAVRRHKVFTLAFKSKCLCLSRSPNDQQQKQRQYFEGIFHFV
jgi:hypothetical protein